MSSIRRNTAFDLTNPIYFAPQTRLEANRWLAMASFGAATAHTNIPTSTKIAFNNLPVTIGGVTLPEVDDATRLMSIGYAAWITEQLTDADIAATIPPESFTLTNFSTFGDLSFGSLSKLPAMSAFFWTTSVHSAAQLKLKLAFALSQIFVVNSAATGTSTASDGPAIMARFYGYLMKATTSTNSSSFRTLLDDVTYSRAMSLMLTYSGNAKEDVATQKRPDENYAREILQLFTIGLKQLNQDGTVIKDANGVELETYAPEDIPEIAKFMTGLGVRTSTEVDVSASTLTGRIIPNSLRHETAAKTLFAYPNQAKVTMPAQLANSVELEYLPNRSGYVISNVTANTFDVTLLLPNPYVKTNLPIRYRLTDNLNDPFVDGTVTSANGGATATITKNGHLLTNGTRIYSYGCVDASLRFALDYIFNHPNCAPFISTALIKFFVTSNPPKEYVARISKIFNDNGNGVRGDLSAVIKAILLDREAIIPLGKNKLNHGRALSFTEKTLKAIRALRNDIVHINYPNTVSDQNVGSVFTEPLFSRPRNLGDYKNCCSYISGGDVPFTASSVFNFHRPGFKPSGTKLSTVGLIAPELQNLTLANTTLWFNQICNACETRSPSRDGFATGFSTNLIDFRGGGGRRGIDLAPHIDGYRVSAKTAGTNFVITGNKSLANTVSSSTRVGYIKRRGGTNTLFNLNGVALSVPITTGASVSITIPTTGTTPDLDDVVDFVPAFVLPSSGFGGCKSSEGATTSTLEQYPFITLLYRLANKLPNTSAAPTTAQLNDVINYLEEILCIRPISEALKIIMRNAGLVTVTEPTHLIIGDATISNHYANFQMTFAQKRVRHMLVMLLASPEFISTNEFVNTI